MNIKVIPYCVQCSEPVLDIHTNHHVCVPDNGGVFVKTTAANARRAGALRAEGKAVRFNGTEIEEK